MEEKIAALHRQFDSLDVNGSGKLDRNEVLDMVGQEGSLLDRLGMCLLFEKYDADKNGTIELGEFLAFYQELESGKLTQIGMLGQLFEIFDKDHNGYLDLREVQDIGAKIGLNISPQEAADTVAFLDQNGDHAVDFAEFTVLLGKA
jgi:Ca2+-binding EF-hand superfamily protein